MTLEQQLAAVVSAKTPRTIQAAPLESPSMLDTRHPQKAFHGKKLGIIVMAGGQATRLNTPLPKGVLPFEPVTGKSLFALLADKLQAFGRIYGLEPLLAVMTSDHTDGPTRQHFLDNDNFGLKDVSFFVQPSLPLLTMQGTLAKDASGATLMGPDGNGSLFKSFALSGILQAWIKQKVSAVGLLIIDNPLLDPFHPDLYLPVFNGVPMTAAAVKRSDPLEQVGLFARSNGKIVVLEYSEIDPSLQKAASQEGSLRYSLANISFFVTTPTILETLSHITTKLHAAKKNVAGQSVWKCEYFIFDYLPYVDNVKVVLIDKKAYFAPIKDPQGFLEAQKLFRNC